ncbi:MAG TPA: tetratricopeptide repeat protein [Polyangiaceae bacterium]|nr:tetratricopeptide repeat protein [Polyangiaceae bacterium]
MSILVLSSAVACAKRPGVVLEERVDTLQRESAPELLLERAHAFASAGDYTRAEQYGNLALKRGGREQDVLPLLVEVCVRDMRYRAAIAYIEHHLRRHPREDRLRFVLAALHVGLGEIEPARETLERVIEQRPDHAGAHYALAVLLRDKLGSRALADAHFREYLRLDPAGPHVEEARVSLLERVR